MTVTIEQATEAAKGGYFYICTPYSKWRGGINDACRMATDIAGRLIKYKMPVYSPIAHTHPIAKQCGINPFDHDIWMPADKPLLEGAAALIVADLPGWRESRGVTQEIEWFRATSKPIYLLDLWSYELETFESNDESTA